MSADDDHLTAHDVAEIAALLAGPSPRSSYGWFGLRCWNGLSDAQQDRLIKVGNLPMGYRPEGSCPRGAVVAIETEHDEAPGPRFYCQSCAIHYLREEM